MPRRCTLISPTNLLLEHPLVSPVDESEFLLFGKKEFDRITRGIRSEWWSLGVMAGMGFAAIVMFLASMWAHR
jgi:hypothetical protein